ncbi:hypothetical protein PVAP13_4NG201477 [Panicum virgatum]|uniref:Uncharacterized protein n=1 Tax=Panicum virgatum TaxID=38727 RepID=A0A8T0T5E9_PANVG|nr:hypothetical protein PVAP13_4NG201477 [Panicum virgatum]
MPPWKLLFDSWIFSRDERLARQGDMGPVIPSDGRFSSMTRRGDSALQVTPCQLQNSNDALLHETKACAELEIWDLKQRRACRSFSVSLEVANKLENVVKIERSQTRAKTPRDAIAI